MSLFLDLLTREWLESQCREDAYKVMAKLHATADHYMKFSKVVVKYHARRTAAAGYANAEHVNMNLHLNANEAEFIDTLMHEFAHSISMIMYGKDGGGHGFRWKSVMLSMGREPKRCHDIDLAEAYPDRWRKVMCVCGKAYSLSKRAVNKAIRGTIYRCDCRSVLQVLTADERQLASRVTTTPIVTQHHRLTCKGCGYMALVTKRRFNLVLRGKTYTHETCGGQMEAK